jgi:hypothetical protein
VITAADLDAFTVVRPVAGATKSSLVPVADLPPNVAIQSFTWSIPGHLCDGSCVSTCSSICPDPSDVFVDGFVYVATVTLIPASGYIFPASGTAGSPALSNNYQSDISWNLNTATISIHHGYFFFISAGMIPGHPGHLSFTSATTLALIIEGPVDLLANDAITPDDLALDDSVNLLSFTISPPAGPGPGRGYTITLDEPVVAGTTVFLVSTWAGMSRTFVPASFVMATYTP